MSQSAHHVCYEGLQEKCHGWHAYESTPNAECECCRMRYIEILQLLGCAPYGYHGTAVELSAWTTDDAASG